MSYEDKAKAPEAPHRLTMDQRERLWVSGVEEVESFDEEEISVLTVRGRLYVRGSGLKVDKLAKDTGELSVSGLVTGLEYQETGPRHGFWSRLLH